MRSQNHYLLPRLLLLLATWPAAITVGQEAVKSPSAKVAGTQKTISYAFVSPNTRENLTLAEALAGLSSLAEMRLIKETRLLACRLHLAPRLEKALGSWSDGAENSTVLRVNTDQATMRYAAAWLGKFARQKSVLYFLRSSFGRSKMYVLLVPRGNRRLAALTTKLESNGVANRTLVPQKNRTLVYIVDLKNELQEKVHSAARRLRARFSSIRGDAEFIGDDNDRDKAQALFQREIMKYEVNHPGVRRACRKKSATTSLPTHKGGGVRGSTPVIDSAATRVLEVLA